MPEDLPVLIVGDVHGDLERLFKALEPYPPADWQTVFLGDLINVGPFGVGALRYSRDRPNSTVLIGNHEVATLWALRDRARVGSWLALGGQQHDLEELARDHDLQAWLLQRPAMVQLPDGTLVQHSDNDGYANLIERGTADPVDAVNAELGRLLKGEQEDRLWDLMTAANVFRRSRFRLEEYLRRMGATRLVHGHFPHSQKQPDTYHDGLALSYDGSFSRFRGAGYARRGPIGATVAPLPVNF
jgi:hypothetical protein